MLLLYSWGFLFRVSQKRFEDHGALDGGPDGLDIVAEILRSARGSLAFANGTKKTCSTPSSLNLGKYGTIVQEGHARF